MAKKSDTPEVDPKAEQRARLEGVMSVVNKKCGAGSIRRAVEIAPIHRIPCGIPELDWALGVYDGVAGFPRGRLTIVAGEESSGKSTICWKVVSQAQAWEEPGVLLDAEGNFEPAWPSQNGIDVTQLIYQAPEFAEQALDVMDEMLRAMENGVLVIDSIAALTPTAEIEESTSDWQQGLGARLVNKGMRKMQSAMNSTSRTLGGCATVLAIQQFRTKLDKQRGPSDDMPYGKGQRYAASIIIKLWAGKVVWWHPARGKTTEWSKDLADVGTQIGKVLHFQILKNKTAAPHRTGEFEIYNVSFAAPDGSWVCEPSQVNVEEQVLRAAVRAGLVKKAGSWLSQETSGGRSGWKAQGEAQAVTLFQKMPDVVTSLIEGVTLFEQTRAGAAPKS